ncbi:hypothetical protein ONZ45_g3076 [Pleurotus djamor]|nr:hypothetical protein ONZ45_g3076 [Pleurotus djamor]
MQLIQSKSDPRNTTFSSDSGELTYAVETPFHVLENRVSTISKVSSNVEQSQVLAEIEWHRMGSTVVKFKGRSMSVGELFRRVGFAWRHRVFVGPDGKEYIWKLGSRSSKLFLYDTVEMPIARSHKSSLGVFGSSHPASLEIFPEGEHMLDMILVTFVYIEKQRRDNERASRSAAASGGG